MRISLTWACLSVALLACWQFLTVHYNWHDNWTALFCTGDRARVPPQLAPTTYRFRNSDGYDGQMYRYVAHDPLAAMGFANFIDAPMRRYQRILVPALAFALAAGRQPAIDVAFIVVIAGFVFAGSYWLCRWAAIQGLHPAWGLAFLVTPATVVSMDRMTIDVAVAAFTVALAYYLTIRSTPRLWCVLALACLARETGGLLVAAMCIYELWSGRVARAFFWAAAIVPMLIWYMFLFTHFRAFVTGVDVQRRMAAVFWGGIFARIADPRRYPLPGALETLARSLDVIALLGIVCAIAGSIVLLSRRLRDPLTITAAVFALLGLLLTAPRYWDECYSYSRVFTPLLIAIALSAVNSMRGTRGWWWMLAPVVMVDLRVGLQLGPQLLGIFRGIAGH